MEIFPISFGICHPRMHTDEHDTKRDDRQRITIRKMEPPQALA